MVTAVVTVGALGAGPLIAGLLAQYGASPRTLPWQLYLGVLAVAALMMLAVPETVDDRTSGVAGIRPRLIHLPQTYANRSPRRSRPRWSASAR